MEALQEYLDDRDWCVQQDLVPFTVFDEELLPHAAEFEQKYTDQTELLEEQDGEPAVEEVSEAYDELYDLARELELSNGENV